MILSRGTIDPITKDHVRFEETINYMRIPEIIADPVALGNKLSHGHKTEWLEQWMNKSYIPNSFDHALSTRIVRESTRCTRSVVTALGVGLPDGAQRPSFGSGLLQWLQGGGWTLQRVTCPSTATVRALHRDQEKMKKNLIVFTTSHVFTMFACGIVVDTGDYLKRKPNNKIESLWEFVRTPIA